MTNTDINQKHSQNWKIHITCYVLLSAILIYVFIAREFRPLVFHDSINLETDNTRLVQQRIDPNTAHWSELARLPRIGEILAKRIVAYREEQKSALGARHGGSSAVFFQIQDLDPVKGIGPKTLVHIEPYLAFPANRDAQTP